MTHTDTAARVQPPRMVTIRECAKETGISYYALRRMCLNDEITYFRIGTKFLINLDLLIDQMNGKKAQP